MAEPGTGERRMGARYRLDQADGTWWELGWDRPLGTFYAQHHDPLPYDPFTGGELLAWHGTDFRELDSLDALAARLPVAIPAEVAAELAADAGAFPNTGPAPFLAAARDLVAALEAGALGPSDAGGPSPSDGPTADHIVPAAPLAEALRVLHADPLLADDDVDTFARGLGIDPDLAAGVLGGRTEGLTVEEAAQVCRALRCGPEEIWGPEVGDELVRVHPDHRWPAGAEALGAASEAGHGAGGLAAASGNGGPVVVATCYAEAGVLAVDAHGHARPVDDVAAPPGPDEDYHLRFRQVADPTSLPLGGDSVRLGTDSWSDADPVLAAAGQRLRDRLWPEPVDLVHFSGPDGGEQWLGRRPGGGAWETWDDPRLYYPGDPGDVVDPAGHLQPGEVSPQLHLDLVAEEAQPEGASTSMEAIDALEP